MAVPYHTHTFEIPAATKDDMIAGIATDKAVTPSSLGSCAVQNVEDFATAEQGRKADSAVQPEDLAKVATSGDYSDLKDLPTLGTAASMDATAFASASQGAAADTAVQPHDLGSAARHDEGYFATAAQAVPAGGLSKQVLAKKSNHDNDTHWILPPGSDNVVFSARKNVEMSIGSVDGATVAFIATSESLLISGTIYQDTTPNYFFTMNLNIILPNGTLENVGNATVRATADDRYRRSTVLGCLAGLIVGETYTATLSLGTLAPNAGGSFYTELTGGCV